MDKPLETSNTAPKDAMITPTQSAASQLQAKYNLGYVWLISVVAAMGGLLFGWDWVVIGGAKPFFQRYFELTSEAQIGWANSCALIGCLFGSLAAGALSDRFGRKRLLILAAVIFAVTSIGNALAHNFTVFIAWRMVGGVAIGLASSLSPMYISEVAPAQMRGKLVSINQLTIVIGILLAQYINWYLVRNLPQGATDEFIKNSWFGQQGWRWMFGLTAAPSVLFLLGMFFVPESPRWLAKYGHSERAREVLKRVGGDAYADAATAEIQSTLASEEIQHVRFADLLEPKLGKVLLLGVVLAVFQQWCGINSIFNYAEEIFRTAGYDISTVLKNIAWTGSVNMLFTFVALGTVDRAGRRPLMLLGAAGLAFIYTVMGFCYVLHVQGFPVLLLVLAAIGCYAMSLAPVTWVVISEIFPNRIRGAAMSVAVTALWIACFLLTLTFPILNAKLAPDSPEVTKGDLASLPALCLQLQSGTNAASRFVWEHLPPEAREAAAQPSASDTERVKETLARGLNSLIASPTLWDTNRFAGANLSSETRALLAKTGATNDIARLNRFLVQDTYPALRQIQQVGAARTFWLYAGICVAGFAFILLKLPETKGKTLEQIERELVD
jgi:sugar porter (SP) family MFS transporter